MMQDMEKIFYYHHKCLQVPRVLSQYAFSEEISLNSRPSTTIYTNHRGYINDYNLNGSIYHFSIITMLKMSREAGPTTIT